MQAFLKVFTVSLLVPTSALIGNAFPNRFFSYYNVFAQTNSQAVEVTVPPVAKVFPKQGEPYVCYLSRMDAEKKRLEVVRRGGKQRNWIAIAQIRNIQFRRGTLSDPKPIAPIQGGNKTWSGIPISNIKFKGKQAEITLPSGLARPNRGYHTLLEIMFEPADKVRVKVQTIK